MNARECIREQLRAMPDVHISSKLMAELTGKSENVYRRTLAGMVRDGELMKVAGTGPSRYVRGPQLGKVERKKPIGRPRKVLADATKECGSDAAALGHE